MAVFKCKMCGGTIEFNQGDTVGICDSCGTKQTLPNVNDDAISSLYNRANTLRMKSEFDRAEELYNKIIASDETQAEAYWGIILCKFGIEYVEDPKTFKRVPTCHRTSFDAITADEDFKLAVKYGDAEQKKLYRAEAKAIDAIQKDILNIAKNEKPFDIFICYKETDESGKRTQDSVIANEIYHQLTQEGFKVFYAAITLEDKLGQEYEPYIFAALNSAKVMLVIGSRPEYFTAVWVKNEWSRFLKLMKKDRSKLLIPCYKDMDAYELPDDFAHLQAQNMSKIGFINDIVRGIKKVVDNDSSAQKKSVVKETVVMQNENGNVRALLDRGFMALEDGEWDKADGFFEQALNFDAKIAEAYLGKLMAELRVHRKEKLRKCEEPFYNSNNYQKAVRFGDDKLIADLEGYIKHINERNENNRLTETYTSAINAMNSAETEVYFKAAAHAFQSIADYKDSKEKAKECLEKAEAARKDAVLADGKSKMTGEDAQAYKNAISIFKTIPDWKNSAELILQCEQKIEAIKAQEEADRLEAERKAEERKIALSKAKKITIIFTPIIAGIIVFVIILNSVIIPSVKYNSAVKMMNNGEYIEAIAAFEALDGYKDSATKITECNTAILDGKYNDAIALMDAGKHDEAYSAFIELGDYKDASEKACDIRLQKTKDQLKNIKVGNYINFGAYEQDNNTSNGKEDVEWLVLEVKDGKALVISEYALDCKQYNTSYTDVTWETSTLRMWLNNDFINAAFSAEEKAIIPTVTVSSDKNPHYSTNPGNATQDQVFLLSITEANKYFSSDGARQCEPTDFAVANGAGESDRGNCWWWLRSPGHTQDCAAYVYLDGGVSEAGPQVDNVYGCVRPAIWISL